MNEFIVFGIGCIYFFIPAGLANVAPTTMRWVPLFRYPIDSGLKFNGKPLLGANKTWRGLLFAVLFAGLFGWFQSYLYAFSFFRNISLFDYSTIDGALLGGLLGLGAMVGDAIESVIKRQMNYPPGKSLLIWDQIDWILGALLFSWLLVDLTVSLVVTIIIIFFGIHIFFKHLGVWLKMDDKKW